MTPEVVAAICNCGAYDQKLGREVGQHVAGCDVLPPPKPVSQEDPNAGFPNLAAKVVEWIRAHRSEQPEPHENHASSLGDPCERRLYLSRTGAKRAPVSDELAAIFQLGHDLEAHFATWYRRIGMRPELNQSKFRVIDPETGEVLWVGRTDGVLVDDVTGDRLAYDDKSCRDGSMRPDLQAKAVAQLQLYMGPDALDMERGVIVPWNKGTGIPDQINVRRDPAEYARLMDKARRINAAVKAQEPPPQTEDMSLCERCWFRGYSCHPAVIIDGTGLIDHAAIEAKLVEAVKLEADGKRYKKLAEELKEAFKGNKDGTYLTPDGIEVKVKTTTDGKRIIRWRRANEAQEV